MPVTNLNGRFAARIWHLEKGDPVSLNNCAPVCVNVLANPVTNSVYYKAAMSWLPRQGCIPTGVVCKAQRRISWILPHHLSLEWPRNFICLFPEPESTLAFSWFPSPPPPGSFLHSPALHSLGQFIYSSEGGAALNLSQGPGANQNCSGAFQGTELITPLGKKFSKRSLLVTVLWLHLSPFMSSEPGQVFARNPVLSALPLSPPSGAERETSGKSSSGGDFFLLKALNIDI